VPSSLLFSCVLVTVFFFIIIIPIKMDACVYICVCVCLCLGITLERIERFRSNLVHTLLYVCVKILCMFYIYSAGRMVWEAGNLDDSHC
jgi:uncharacterized membrane protein AbrB (regulator of aidB expression)